MKPQSKWEPCVRLDRVSHSKDGGERTGEMWGKKYMAKKNQMHEYKMPVF